jgi:hypothetical protein
MTRHRIKWTVSRAIILFISTMTMLSALSSCGTSSSCVPCNPTVESVKKASSTRERWNVELYDGESPIYDECSGSFIRSVYCEVKPDSIPAFDVNGAYIRVFKICTNGNSERVIELRIPSSRIKSITSTANPLVPPTQFRPEVPCVCCERERKGLGIFDKVELRAGLHYRGSPDSITYLSANGSQTRYGSSLFGTDRGGSTLVPSLEAALLWQMNSLDNSGRFHLGPMIAILPVDGALFFPITIHPRYTFNQQPSPYSSSCNSWYVFGDLGIPVDFTSKAVYFSSDFGRQRYFLGAGIGYEWAMGKTWDLSIDGGYRRMNLPLPQTECCPTIPDDLKNPFRASDMLFLRFGITW